MALLVGLPVGYAIADIGESSSGGETTVPTAEEWARIAADGPVENPPHDGGPEVDYYSEGPMAPEIVSACREDRVEGGSGDPLLCDLIVAVADGELEAGEYSTAEVRALESAEAKK
jgi:hypothetical protein